MLDVSWKKHPKLKGLFKKNQEDIHFISAEPNAKGISWKYYGPNDNEGWIYGSLNEKSEFTGNKIAYIYPNFKVALLGKFMKEFMLEAREVRITAYR